MKNILIITPLSLLCMQACTKVEQSSPNIIVIYTDDQGYQDLGCYGSPNIKTPALDKMAQDGLKLTSFYVSASVSSASRASLLTGRLNTHNGVAGVYFPDDGGLPAEEITMAEALGSCGYNTICIGKWHLGDIDGYLPTQQGFDEYYGIPYSNDMYIGAGMEFAEDVEFRDGYTLEKAMADQQIVAAANAKNTHAKGLHFASPLFEQNKIAEYPCNQSTLTRRYFDRAIEFISKRGEEPFFTYIAPSMPHYPLFVSEQFEGTSEGGLYGDVIEEIDWNVERLLDHLDREGLAENTIVIFASDNGPWIEMKEQSGHADPLRAGKFTQYDGGVRVPFIVRWPGRIPAGVESDAVSASIDIFPTLMHYAGYDCSQQERAVDGVDVSAFWEDPTNIIRDEYLYVRNGNKFGLRKGDWIYLPKSGAKDNKKSLEPQPELFNITDDISQMENLYDQYPEKVSEMEALFARY